ncbi:hypothetical protein ACP275_08G175100 [Erythranthe tilingii]
MASISSSITAIPFSVCSSSTISSRPQLSFPCSNPSKLLTVKPARISNSRILAAPEALEPAVDSAIAEGEAPLDSSDKVSPKQKIRIKLRSYWVPLIEDSCKQIMDAARTTNAKTVGPVPLPTKRRVHCVLKSPHVHKDARFHFEIRTHQRLIDILYPTAQTIDSLMQLDLPAGVDVEVKL